MNQRFPMHVFDVACHGETHHVLLMSDGRLDFSDHWAKLGIPYRCSHGTDAEAREGLIALANYGKPRANTHDGCMEFLAKWRKSLHTSNGRSPVPYNDPAYSYISAIEELRRCRKAPEPSVADNMLASEARLGLVKERLRQHAQASIASLVDIGVRRHRDITKNPDGYIVHVPPLDSMVGDEKNSYLFDFSRWWNNVYRRFGADGVVTSNQRMTLDASPIRRRSGLTRYALVQTNVVQYIGGQNGGFSRHEFQREKPSLLFIAMSEGEIVGQGKHPRDQRFWQI